MHTTNDGAAAVMERLPLTLPAVNKTLFAKEIIDHCTNVSLLAGGFAHYLRVPAVTCQLLQTTGLLHDLGKFDCDMNVLMLPRRLTAEEMTHVKRHVEFGVHRASRLSLSHAILKGVQFHHENWNGTGYPFGLSGEHIPFIARVLRICDVYDALVSKRPYKPAFTHEKALEIMGATGHHDPLLLEGFMDYTAHRFPGVIAR